MSIHDGLPVLVRGVRTPFVKTGGSYSSLMSYQLGARAIAGLVERTGIDPARIDMVAMGTVLQEVETTNVAREAMLSAGLLPTTPAYTLTMAGLSPNVAVGTICDMIALGRIEVGIAGGTESFSDPPLRASQNVRRSLMKLHQNRSAKTALKALASLRPGDLVPDFPSGTDFTTRKTMGACTETMVKKFGVLRDDCDRFAARSHALAAKARDAGLVEDDIAAVECDGGLVMRDDSIREDATFENLAKLKPAFDRKAGVITAGNSSGFTDGAAAVLLASFGAAERIGLEPQAAVRDYVLTGVSDLETEMLLGPAMAIPRLLKRNNLKVEDIEVWELHEAFAAQILANQVCLASEDFARTHLAMDQAPGPIPIERLNTWGGSLALGNPFSATGGRLLATAARRLQAEDARYAVVSSCAGGGLGAAILLENASKL